MNSCLDVPSPAGCRENATHSRGKADVQCINDRLWWHCRMEIDWDIERFSALHNWPEELVIQIAAVRMAVDERTLKPCCRTLRSSSSAACSGAATGRAANPANRFGFFFTTSARKSFASRAIAT